MNIILPGILIFLIAAVSTFSKYVLLGIYVLFPIIFIIQGVKCTERKEFIVGLILSSVGFLIPINLFYNMGSCIVLVVIYNILSIISYFIKKKISKKNI